MKTETQETRPTQMRDRAKEPSGSEKTNGMDPEMQKKFEAAATPGPSHKALDAFVGDWDAQVKTWCGPGGDTHESRGTAKAAWILKGHFLEEEFHGEMHGKPFVGRTILGYDNVKQTFNSLWISDAQTAMMTNEGKGSEGNKVITLEGTTECPVSGRTDIPTKLTYRILGADKRVLEMSTDGQKSMEVTYTRR